MWDRMRYKVLCNDSFLCDILILLSGHGHGPLGIGNSAESVAWMKHCLNTTDGCVDASYVIECIHRIIRGCCLEAYFWFGTINACHIVSPFLNTSASSEYHVFVNIK